MNKRGCSRPLPLPPAWMLRILLGSLAFLLLQGLLPGRVSAQVSVEKVKYLKQGREAEVMALLAADGETDPVYDGWTLGAISLEPERMVVSFSKEGLTTRVFIEPKKPAGITTRNFALSPDPAGDPAAPPGLLAALQQHLLQAEPEVFWDEMIRSSRESGEGARPGRGSAQREDRALVSAYYVFIQILYCLTMILGGLVVWRSRKSLALLPRWDLVIAGGGVLLLALAAFLLEPVTIHENYCNVGRIACAADAPCHSVTGNFGFGTFTFLNLMMRLFGPSTDTVFLVNRLLTVFLMPPLLFALMLEITGKPRIAALSIPSLLLFPIYLRMGTSDTMLALSMTLGLASVLMTVRLARTRDLQDLVVLGLLLGLTVQTSVVYHLLPIACVIVFILSANLRASFSWKLLLVPLLALAASWFHIWLLLTRGGPRPASYVQWGLVQFLEHLLTNNTFLELRYTLLAGILLPLAGLVILPLRWKGRGMIPFTVFISLAFVYAGLDFQRTDHPTVLRLQYNLVPYVAAMAAVALASLLAPWPRIPWLGRSLLGLLLLASVPLAGNAVKVYSMAYNPDQEIRFIREAIPRLPEFQVLLTASKEMTLPGLKIEPVETYFPTNELKVAGRDVTVVPFSNFLKHPEVANSRTVVLYLGTTFHAWLPEELALAPTLGQPRPELEQIHKYLRLTPILEGELENRNIESIRYHFPPGKIPVGFYLAQLKEDAFKQAAAAPAELPSPAAAPDLNKAKSNPAPQPPQAGRESVSPPKAQAEPDALAAFTSSHNVRTVFYRLLQLLFVSLLLYGIVRFIRTGLGIIRSMERTDLLILLSALLLTGFTLAFIAEPIAIHENYCNTTRLSCASIPPCSQAMRNFGQAPFAIFNLFFLVGGSLTTSAMVVNSLISVSIILLTFFLALAIFADKRTAALCALSLALLPVFLKLGPTDSFLPLSLALLLAALLTAIELALRPGLLRGLAAGAALGLAIQTSMVYNLLPLLALGAFLLSATRKGALRYLGPVALGLALMLGSSLLHVARLLMRRNSFGGYFNLDKPLSLLGDMVCNNLFLNPDYTPMPVLTALVLGVPVLVLARGSTRRFIPLLAILIFGSVYFPIDRMDLDYPTRIRVQYSLAPFFALLMGLGLNALLKGFSRGPRLLAPSLLGLSFLAWLPFMGENVAKITEVPVPAWEYRLLHRLIPTLPGLDVLITPPAFNQSEEIPRVEPLEYHFPMHELRRAQGNRVETIEIDRILEDPCHIVGVRAVFYSATVLHGWLPEEIEAGLVTGPDRPIVGKILENFELTPIVEGRIPNTNRDNARYHFLTTDIPVGFYWIRSRMEDRLNCSEKGFTH